MRSPHRDAIQEPRRAEACNLRSHRKVDFLPDERVKTSHHRATAFLRWRWLMCRYATASSTGDFQNTHGNEMALALRWRLSLLKQGKRPNRSLAYLPRGNARAPVPRRDRWHLITAIALHSRRPGVFGDISGTKPDVVQGTEDQTPRVRLSFSARHAGTGKGVAPLTVFALQPPAAALLSGERTPPLLGGFAATHGKADTLNVLCRLSSGCWRRTGRNVYRNP